MDETVQDIETELERLKREYIRLFAEPRVPESDETVFKRVTLFEPSESVVTYGVYEKPILK